MPVSASETKQKIKHTVLELLKTKEIDRIKVKTIIEASQISRGTFYLYFDSAFAVLQEIEDEFFADMDEIYQQNLKYPFNDKYFDSPHPMLLDLLKFSRSHQKIYESLLGRYGEPLFQHKVKKLAQKNVIDRALHDGYIKIEPRHKNLISRFIIGGHSALIAYVSSNCSETDDGEMAMLIYRLLFSSYRSSWMKDSPSCL
jgi:AcrR family transcriptional regulator